MASAGARAQISEFLRFFDVKRELYVTEVGHVFQDVKDARLFDDMYSKDDVEDIFTDLINSVKERVKKDLESSANMAALVLEQVMSAAEESGVSVKVDMSRTEDESALVRIRELNFGIGAADADVKKKNVVKLESLRDEHQRLVADNMRLHEECEALKERYMMMQMQASELTKEKADFSAKVESLQTQLRALQSGSSSAAAQSAAQEAELQKLRNTIAELHGQVETMKTKTLTAEKEREASVNTSKPFLMMKQLLTKKNAQLAELRAALKRYEPEKEDADADVVSK